MSSNLGLLGLEIFGSDFDIRCDLVGIGKRSKREVGTRGLKPSESHTELRLLASTQDTRRLHQLHASGNLARFASAPHSIQAKPGRLREGKNKEVPGRVKMA